jgi:hypothetical protein
MEQTMTNFRYSNTGNWYKGNTHLHSTASDGGKNFTELAQLYAGAGYDFLFRTDHWVSSDVSADTEDYPLLWLDGVELDGRDQHGSMYHVAALGKFQGLEREMGFQKALESARAQNGLLVLAHPHWMGNTFEEALRWNFDGVEVYNHVCQWLNGKGHGGPYWNAVLSQYPNTLGLAVDDAHTKPSDPGWNGGWVVVNAPECSYEAVMAALRAGNFYSSSGPEIYAIQQDGDTITVDCSAVQFARLVGPAYRGMNCGSFDGQTLTQASFKIPTDWPYMFLEIEDDHGKRAWSNPLFVQA